MSYASMARRELPNATVAVDDATEALSRDGSFSAVHVLTSREGVEVQINAFNFPVWGMLEKLAPAFIAGMPSIVKPASSTAYLAEAVVRLIVESGILPEGVLQFVCASPDELGGLLDCLGGQDSVAFTGSGATAAVLRTHPAVTERAARLNVEADSLNAAVLAPAAVPGTAEFGLFTDEVVKEMTVKAGQKCTAIRRVLVPAQHLDTAAEALAAALSDVVVGDPRDRTSGMGPLVGLAQRHEVAAAVAALREVAVPVVDSCDLSGVDAVAGAFMAPTLLQARDRRSTTVHTVEAFGPVSTLMPYSSIDEAIELVAAGGGSLVASLYGPDRDEIAALATGIASHHGRVLIMDSPMAAASTGHGSPLAAAGARRAGPGRGRAGDGRHAGRVCPHAAHRGPGLARHADRGDRRVHRRLGHPGAQGAPVQAHLRRPGGGRLDNHRVAHRDPGRHRRLRGEHRRQVLRPHGRRGRGPQPDLQRAGGARLPGAVVRGRAVRVARRGPGAGQLRHRPAALRQAHLPRRRHPRRAHMQAQDPARRGAATARWPGTPGSSTSTARSTRPTTC